jgi:hypothetical protein
MKDNFYTVPIKELITPKTGLVVLVDYYWFVKDDAVLCYKLEPYGTNLNQCNRDKIVLEYIQNSFDVIDSFNPYKDGFEIVKIPLAYVERM